MELLWSTFAGIAIGVAGGVALAYIGWKLRGDNQRHELMDDFLGLGLMGTVYGVLVLAHAWGFLAVFFSAVALHQTERKLMKNRASSEDSIRLISEESLVFKEHLGRLSEVLLVLLIGGTLFLDSWSWKAVAFALFLFVVARPISVVLGLLGTGTSWRIRGLAGWFGVRGIGSLYYLMYALQHDLPESLGLELIQFTLVVVTLSIVLHGLSAKPMMFLFKAKQTPK